MRFPLKFVGLRRLSTNGKATGEGAREIGTLESLAATNSHTLQRLAPHPTSPLSHYPVLVFLGLRYRLRDGRGLMVCNGVTDGNCCWCSGRSPSSSIGRSLFVYPFACLSLALCPIVCLSASLSLCVHVHVSGCACVYISFCLCLSLCPSICRSASSYLFVCVSVMIILCVCLSLSPTLFVFRSIYLSLTPPVGLPVSHSGFVCWAGSYQWHGSTGSFRHDVRRYSYV